MSMQPKFKEPERVQSKEIGSYYKNHSFHFIAEGESTRGYRYDQIVGRKLQKPDGTEFTNNVTLSQASSEVLTLFKRNGEWCFVFGVQSRSPYLVNVEGELYCKLFLEQAAGLLEEDQDFVQAAIAETSQELGVELKYLGVFIPKVCRHVSYTDEVSTVFLAIAETIGKQRLDKYENIEVVIIPVDDVRKYLDGEMEVYLGLDIPEMTMLSLERFFRKLDTGKLDLDNLQGNLLNQ